MDVSEILTIIIGYIYLFLSIGINIIKVVYIFIKKKVLPNLLLYYVLKVLSGCAGLLYGLTFLDKVGYYLVTPFLAVVLLDFIVLGIICVLNLKQYINNLHKIHPEGSINNVKPKLKKSKKRFKKKIKNITIKKPNKMRRIKSSSNLKPYKRNNTIRQIKSENSLEELEQTFMSNYIKHILAGYTFNNNIPILKNRITITPQCDVSEEVKSTKKKTNKGNKKKKHKKSNDGVKDALMDEGEDIEEFLFDDDDEELDDLEDDDDIDIDDGDEDEDDGDDEDEDGDEDEDEGGGLLDYLGELMGG